MQICELHGNGVNDVKPAATGHLRCEPDREVSVDASQLYDLVRRLKFEGTEGSISQPFVVSKQDEVHQPLALKETDRPGIYVEMCIVFDEVIWNPDRGAHGPCAGRRPQAEMIVHAMARDNCQADNACADRQHV